MYVPYMLLLFQLIDGELIHYYISIMFCSGIASSPY